MQSLLIDTPDVPALPFGLTSVADIKPAADPHTLGGFEYQTTCGHGAGFAVNPCTSVTGATTGGSASVYPASVTINSDLPGDYVITWTNGTPTTDTVTFVEGDTTKTVSHTFTTTGPKTVSITGPVGFGTRTIVLNASTTVSGVQGDAFNKAALPSVVTVLGDPVTMVSKYVCTPVGVDQATMHKRAMDGLNRSESVLLERALKARVLAGATVDLTGGTATSPQRALALLENYAAQTYAGVPTIHVDRFVGSLMAQNGQIARHGTRLETVQGARVASGAGYSVHPLASPTWAWVTGMVVVRQGKAQVRESLNQQNNDYVTLAEQTAVFAVECIVAKAQIVTT